MTQPMHASKRRYLRRIWPTWIVYIIVLLAALWLLQAPALSMPIRYLVAIAPSLPLLAIIYFVGQLMYGKEDEFQRALWSEAMLWGTAITLAATTVWGFLEIAGAPSIRLYWVFPFFTAAALLSVPFLSRKYQ